MMQRTGNLLCKHNTFNAITRNCFPQRVILFANVSKCHYHTNFKNDDNEIAFGSTKVTYQIGIKNTRRYLHSTIFLKNKRFPLTDAGNLKNSATNVKDLKDPNKHSSVKSKLKSFSKFVLYGLIFGTGYLGYNIYRESHPSKQSPQSTSLDDGSPRKTLVILGTGWGAVSLLQKLDSSLYNVIVISPRNYFLFTPLLTSTPMGTINLKSIMEPIRSIMRRSKSNIVFHEAWANDVDPVNKKIIITPVNKNKHNNDETPDTIEISYDYLVVSVGAESTTFNIPGVNENAIFLKEVEDSQRIRDRILKNIEKATFLKPNDPQRSNLLNFVIVGGGPTGVEFAADLKDFVDQDLTKTMPDIASDIRVSLIEGLPNILNMFDKSLIEYTQDFLKFEKKIDLRLNTMVKTVEPDYLVAKTKDGKEAKIPFGVLVWSTGIRANPLCQKIASHLPKVQTEKRGLLINDKLQLLGAEDSIFAVGDCTFHPGLVPTAQVAHQEGVYLAKTFKTMAMINQLDWQIKNQKQQLLLNKNNKVDNDNTSIKKHLDLMNKNLQNLKKQIVDFKYLHKGTLAYIGSDKAIIQLNYLGNDYKFSGGSYVFWLWKYAYLSMCVSLRNRVMVTTDWISTYIFGRD